MKAIIIDDEKRARISLTLLLQEYCPNVEIVADCENLTIGVKAIRKFKPDLILLDIEMPGHSGLELLDFFDESEINFSIIFTTAYNQYAIEAFKFSAIDYLLKPIDPDLLVSAITRFEKQTLKLENLKALKENLSSNNPYKIAIPCGNSLIFIETSKIDYIKGERAYSELFCNDNTKKLVSRNLKNFEDVLAHDLRFIRVHKSYIINFDNVKTYHKSDGGSLELESGVFIPVSSDKTQIIMDKIKLVKR